MNTKNLTCPISLTFQSIENMAKEFTARGFPLNADGVREILESFGYEALVLEGILRSPLIKLKLMIDQKARRLGHFTLASQEEAGIYYDIKKLLLDPQGITLISEIVSDYLCNTGIEIDAIGGHGLGGSLIIPEVLSRMQAKNKPIPGFIVRDEVKDHGTRELIEGSLEKGWRVAIIDDVLSTGRTVLKTIQTVIEKGAKVTVVTAILDRRQYGGSIKLLRNGYTFKAFLTVDSSGKISY